MIVLTLLGSVCPAAAAAEDAAPAAPAPPYDVRPLFDEGRSTRYEVWGKRTMRMDLQGPFGQRTLTQTMVSEGEVTWKVQRIGDDGSATCEMTLLWMSLTVQADDGEPRSVDSRDGVDNEDAMSVRIGALVEKPIVFEMNADGSVQSVRGVDRVREAFGQGAGSDLKDAVFLEQASTLATLPRAPATLDLDGQWSSTNVWSRNYGNLRGDLQNTMNYRLGGVESVAGIPVATVTGEAQLGFDPDPDMIPDSGPQIDVQMTNGRATTQIMFDLQRHEVVGRNDVEKVRIETSIESEQINISTVMEETTQNQVLRVAEE